MSTPTAALPVHKREPAAVATGIVSLLATLMFVAPSMGIAFPDSIAKIVTIILTIAAGLGIRSAVVPAAKLKP